ncbi:hypothetical protein [Azospirillum argentinense]|uniref:hypothetical protein n=1 Tax=Azospirillum argentinense TaxID=2970906 RepID=UPI000A6ED051|nr:hypothetical protein [Azospirillum argentinense]
MIRYAVYMPDTGQILRTGFCAPDAAPLQAGPGEAVTEVPANVTDETHRIMDGQAVEKE